MMGLNQTIYFGQVDAASGMKYDLSINRRNVMNGPKIKSNTGLKGFKIGCN